MQVVAGAFAGGLGNGVSHALDYRSSGSSAGAACRRAGREITLRKGAMLAARLAMGLMTTGTVSDSSVQERGPSSSVSASERRLRLRVGRRG